MKLDCLRADWIVRDKIKKAILRICSCSIFQLKLWELWEIKGLIHGQ